MRLCVCVQDSNGNAIPAVETDPVSGLPIQDVINGTDLSFTKSNLSVYTMYIVAISATTSVGEGPRTANILARTGQALPTSVLNVRGAASGTLSWSEARPVSKLPKKP